TLLVGWGGFLEVICSWDKFGQTRPYRDNRVGMGRFFVLTVLAGAIIANRQSLVPNHQSPITNRQSLVPNP
ncbi:MAG: hypothetical protein ACRCT1_10315, partial [Microcoleaceae cyanobacterium]